MVLRLKDGNNRDGVRFWGELVVVWAWGSQCKLNGAVWTQWGASVALGRAVR